jgi:hypothetical protein
MTGWLQWDHVISGVQVRRRNGTGRRNARIGLGLRTHSMRIDALKRPAVLLFRFLIW